MPRAVGLFIQSTTIECLLCARDTAGKAAVTGMMSIYREQRAYVMGNCPGQGVRNVRVSFKAEAAVI